MHLSDDHHQNWHFEPNNGLVKKMTSTNFKNLILKTYYACGNLASIGKSTHYRN